MQTPSNSTDTNINGLGSRPRNPSSPASNSSQDQKHEGNASSSSPSGGVAKEFHNFIADIEDLITQATSLTGEDLAQAKAKISARLASAKESVADLGDSLSQRARATAAFSNQYVHEQPWKVVGASAAIGFLLGFVLAARRA